LCERHGCHDPNFPDFIRTLLKMDPIQRVTAEAALKLPFLKTETVCPPYKLAAQDKSGEAGLRLLEKYKSLENVDSPTRGVGPKGSSKPFGEALADDDVPGPATPTSFREQCYLDRERMEKKRSRKSGIARWVSGGGSSSNGNNRDHHSDMPNMDSMMISPNKGTGADPKKGRSSDD